MNWYKQAQSPKVEFNGFWKHDTDEIDTEFRIYLNGKPYTYYGIGSKEAGELRWMINNPKIPGGVVLKRLKPYSDPQIYKKINPTTSGPDTEEEKQQMLSELPSQKELWG